MSIFAYNHLDMKHRQDFINLVNICNTYEGLERLPALDNENLYEDMTCFYLHYIDDMLISALVIEQLGQEEAEITGYTLPAFRRQGYFYNLLDKALDELFAYDIYKVILPVENVSKSGSVVASLLGKYEYSEYMLVHNLKNLGNNQSLRFDIQFEQVDHVDEIYNIFTVENEEQKEALKVAEMAIESDDMMCYIGVKERKAIGLCCVNLKGDRAYLFGLYVLESFRQEGFGKALVEHILKVTLSKNKKGLMLQVSSKNIAALKLYQKIGFQVLKQYDYYSFYIEEDEDNELS